MKAFRFASSLVILLMLISFLSPGNVYGQDYAYQEDFEDGQARGWELESGWQVIQDEGNYILAGQGHTWARSNQSFDGDLRLKFRVKLLQGRVHLVVCLTDASRYFIGFEASGSDLSKQYFPDVFHNNIAALSAPHSLNRWYQVEIILQGSTIEFLVDGRREWLYVDPQPLTGGSFAFETQESSNAYLDDIRVEIGEVATPASATSATVKTVTATPRAAAGLTWIRTGGPLGGLGYDVRMRPDNPDVMLVTDAWAGVFMSTDSGQTWFPSNKGITTRVGLTGDGIPVFSLTIDPNNPDIVWAGTQFTRGIFKSTDGGYTWKKMINGIIEAEGITFRGFAIDPTNSDVVYAAAELSSWAWSSDREVHPGREFDLTAGVVYKTTNGGQSWRAIWRGQNLARYVWINPQDTNILYISTGIFDREAANSDPVAGIPGGEGVVKSTDGGISWAHVNNGLGNLYVGSLFMHPNNPDILLAGTGNVQYQDGGGVYLTTDGGMTWRHTLSSIFTEAVEFAISNPEIAYAGDAYGIYRSEDGGQTWILVSGSEVADNRFGWGSTGVRGGHPIDFQVDPRDANRIFINAYGGGNFLSEDGGRTWIDTSKGYTGAQARDIVVDPAEPGRVLVAGRSGVFLSLNGGNDWEGLNYPELFSSEWAAVAIDPQNSQYLLASNIWTNSLANSTNGGYAWHIVEQLDQKTGWQCIVFSPSNPSIVYAGSAGYFSAGAFDYRAPGNGIYRSRDGGITWLPANDSISQDAFVSSLAVSPTDPQTIFAATTNHGLLKTSNGGATWTAIKNGLSTSAILLSVAIHPTNENILLAGLRGGAIYRTSDGGQTWSYSASGLNPEASVVDIIFDPTNPETLYLADLFSGVYRSADGGRIWTAINNGLDSRFVNALAISYDGLHLYAATEGAGVFRLDLNGQPPNPAPRVTSTPTSSTGFSLSPTSSPTMVIVPTSNISTAVPTTTQGAEPGTCVDAVALQLAIFGLVLWKASRKQVKK